MNKTGGIAKFLIWTFALSYLLEAGIGLLYKNGINLAVQPLMLLLMFLPMISLLLSGGKLKSIGWGIHFKKHLPYVMIAWFSPFLLTVLGGGLYFLCFPAHFDTSGAYLIAAGGEEALKQMQAQGISYPLYILISGLSAITYAPFINMIFALGEEIGWRGFLYPQLKEKFGARGEILLGGVIWSAFHWPLIWLIGYEYGTAYFGFPYVGMLLFTVFTVPLGILCDWVYEKTNSIWIPSLLHGAINAVAALPLMLCIPDTGAYRLLGPVPNGLIAGIPLLLFAAAVFFSKTAKPQED